MLVLAPALTACDRVKTALNPPQVDRSWANDSALLASNPTVLFRVVRDKRGNRIVPVATVGARGMRALSLSNRGWRALDLTYLQGGASVVPYRDATPLAPVSVQRGMWEGAPLDTIQGCRVLLPSGLVAVPDGVDFFTSGQKPLRTVSSGLNGGELQEVLNATNTLIAPSAGVSLSKMSRYTRSVHVVSTGATDRPTIVVSYDDPEEIPDSANRMTERPRQLIVVLDKGVYGFKPSLTLADISQVRVSPRRVFLGAIDSDGDGKSELLFGVKMPQFPLVMFAYRYEGGTWVESFSYERGQCHG